MTRLTTYLSGTGLMARIARSASWIMVGYGAGQALRLASNLILARILFPEAFGLMALITMVTVGLQLFSDFGIKPAIAQSKRGDDPDFLNTAWTMQVLRGGVLYVLVLVLAAPIAAFYDEPLLETYLPIAGLSLLIIGFQPTRVATAQRHLILGRVTRLELLTQALSVTAMVWMAYLTGSVIALVIGAALHAAIHVTLNHVFLPGLRNSFRWDRSAIWELFGFGKWIFLSTACFFFSGQGDKAVLGKLLSLELLGIYNIGYFLASFPIAMGIHLAQNMLIPVYRERPPGESTENFQDLARLRHLATAGLLAMIFAMALMGPWLVGGLYDERYILAGGIVVLVSIVQMVQALGVTYDNAALAAGDSRQFFFVTAGRTALQFGLLILGVSLYGLIGGIVGIGLAYALAHPLLIWLARTHKAWDARHDLLWAGVVLAMGATALWVNADAVAQLAGI